MATTYKHQLQEDEALIEAETSTMLPEQAVAERAGRYAVLAHRYAAYADYEAARRQRLQRDTEQAVGGFCDDRR